MNCYYNIVYKMIENDWDWTKKIKIVEKIYESI